MELWNHSTQLDYFKRSNIICIYCLVKENGAPVAKPLLLDRKKNSIMPYADPLLTGNNRALKQQVTDKTCHIQALTQLIYFTGLPHPGFIWSKSPSLTSGVWNNSLIWSSIQPIGWKVLYTQWRLPNSALQNYRITVKIKTRGPWATMLTWVKSHKSLIQHFSLSVAMVTNQNDYFASKFYAWWKTTQQTILKKVLSKYLQ